MQSERDDHTRSNSARHIGNIVLKIEGYSEALAGNHCFPGQIHGKVMGGLLDGRNIAVAIRRTSVNQRSVRVADLQDKAKMSFTPVGGYLSLEGVRSQDGQLTARWLNRMGGPDAIIRSGMPIQIAPSYGRDGKPRRFKVNDATVYNATILHLAGSETATSEPMLKSALGETLEKYGAAFIALAPNRSSTTAARRRSTFYAIPSWKPESGMSTVDETVGKFMQRYEKNNIKPHFKSEASIDVVPMEIVRLGSRVCESIDLGARNAVPLTRYMTGGLGERVETALRQIDKEQVERLEAAFLSQAHDDARNSFAAQGWKGVWNIDIERFFADAAVQLPQVPRYGFAISTAFLKPYGGESDALYLAKSRALTSALPKDAVPSPSDPDAHLRYYDNILEAVRLRVESLPESPSIEREKAAEKAAEKAHLGACASEPDGLNMEFGADDKRLHQVHQEDAPEYSPRLQTTPPEDDVFNF